MSIILEATVDISSFKEWAEVSKRNVIATMKNTLLEASKIIENTTNPLVPYKSGLLEGSYKESIHTAYPLVEMEYGYSVTYNPKGNVFDYALVQHENYPKKKLRGQMYFLRDGIRMSKNEVMLRIERDYLTALGE